MSIFRSAQIALAAGVLLTAGAAGGIAADRLEFAIVLHGGAGDEPEKLTAEEKEDHRQALRRALEVGRKILADGGTSLDAVEQTIRTLEDDPRFNAGHGAVFNSEGRHELDASIMDGKTGGAGAVGGVTTVKNPISLARLVMTQTRHVLLAGPGAEKFADEMKDNPLIERVPNTYFDTEAARKEWLEERAKAAAEAGAAGQPKGASGNPPLPAKPLPPARGPDKGTVGCVALDKHGNLAAGTSTGGLTNKKWGRLGDSPIIGAGTYANNATCAISCTGIGEYFIKCSAAFHVSALMQYQGLSLDEAVRQVIEKVLPNDTGGIIAVDRAGHISMRLNTPGMFRAAADSTGKTIVELGR